MPVRKVGAGALAGALTIILVWAVGLAGTDIPAAVASAITVIITFIVSYFVPAESVDTEAGGGL